MLRNKVISHYSNEERGKLELGLVSMKEKSRLITLTAAWRDFKSSKVSQFRTLSSSLSSSSRYSLIAWPCLMVFSSASNLVLIVLSMLNSLSLRPGHCVIHGRRTHPTPNCSLRHSLLWLSWHYPKEVIGINPAVFSH